jgi:hypothetical protein
MATFLIVPACQAGPFIDPPSLERLLSETAAVLGWRFAGHLAKGGGGSPGRLCRPARNFGLAETVRIVCLKSITTGSVGSRRSRRTTAKDPTNTDLRRELADSMDAIGDVLVKQDRLNEALASYREGLAIRQALAEKNKTNAGAQTDLRKSTDRVGSIAYEFDRGGAFSNGLAAADLAISFAPNETWLYTNRAHALMFLGRVDEARAIYLQHRGEKIEDDRKWETAILADFAELRRKGHVHPLMDEIESLFNKPVSAAKPEGHSRHHRADRFPRRRHSPSRTAAGGA